jgi:hypothetical protein
MWQKELEKLQCQSLAKGQEITGMPFVSGTTDKVGRMAVEMADMETVIRGKIAEIQLQRKKILDYINGIEDSMLRQIVFLRNVSCMSWNEISRDIGGNNTENSVRMMYNRNIR